MRARWSLVDILLVAAAAALIALACLLPAPAFAQSYHLTPQGAQLIVDFEVGGRVAYDRRYSWPVCPACDKTASGVTIGIGYDLRHNPTTKIRSDWAAHPKLPRLVAAQGLGGQRAIAMARSMRDVITPFPYAMQVFSGPGVTPYCMAMIRAFGRDVMKLPREAQDALCSVVYNRGNSMVGPARTEMRYIRDTCVQLWRVSEAAVACINRKLREMVRVWEGGAIEAGMRKRRYAEGRLAMTGRYP